jgi:hypothetical protein
MEGQTKETMNTLTDEEVVEKFLANAPDAWRKHKEKLFLVSVEPNDWDVFCKSRGVGNVQRLAGKYYVAFTAYPHEFELHCTCYLCGELPPQ